MNDSRPFFITHELRAGFLAPLDSLRFFRRHKFLLVSALAPHILLAVGLLWTAFAFGLPSANEQLIRLFPEIAGGDGVSAYALSILVGVAIVVACILLYTLVGVALLNALFSPLFDVMAAKAYVETSGKELPKLGWSDFFRSFLSECSKMILVYTCLVVAFFLPVLVPGGILVTLVVGPAFLLVSIWFFGWDAVDRTLALKGLGLRQRLFFGIRHGLACSALGLWTYVPFAGTLFSFTLAAAGAMVVAKVER